MQQNRAVGIDLGTTYSCLAVLQNGKVEIIANDQDSRTTPSYVAFNDDTFEMLLGYIAKKQIQWNPDTTIFDSKRLIGRKYNDEKLQSEITKKHWPFNVVNKRGKPMISFKYKGEDKTYFPEQISSFVLAHMKSHAERYLGGIVKDAVITVPAYFDDAQRKSTKQAAEAIGLNVLRMINEPTAAALAYGLENTYKGNTTILIYDLGGGTFDISIININNGAFVVKSTAGDTHLGGRDFDNRMVKHFLEEFKQKYKMDPVDEKYAINCLRTACEFAKCTLSTVTQANIKIEDFSDDIDFCSSITRAKFEELCADLFQGTLKEVQKALDSADMDKSKIDEIVLVGGSTYIPKVQKLLKDFFNGKKLNKAINPDEAVAYGAAVMAAKLNDDPSVRHFSVVDVVAHSLGVTVKGDITSDMSFLIKKNTPIPTNNSKIYFTTADNQTSADIQIYEGEENFKIMNNLLGEFCLNPIPPAPAKQEEIKGTFDINADGILEVSAVVMSTGKEMNVTLQL